MTNKAPFFVARELEPGRWRASTDKGYFHGESEEAVRADYDATEEDAS